MVTLWNSNSYSKKREKSAALEPCYWLKWFFMHRIPWVQYYQTVQLRSLADVRFGSDGLWSFLYFRTDKCCVHSRELSFIVLDICSSSWDIEFWIIFLLGKSFNKYLRLHTGKSLLWKGHLRASGTLIVSSTVPIGWLMKTPHQKSE